MLLGITLLPTAFWFWWFWRRDVHPEPPWLLARTLAWGGLAWIISAAFQLSFRGLPIPLLVMVLTALSEEGLKFLAAGTAVRERSFDEPMDGLVYAVTAALGFALLENVAYGWRYGPEVAAWHALITTLAHALFSAPLGYALGRTYFTPDRKRFRLARGLAVSVALHLGFNGLLSGTSGWPSLLALAGLLALMYGLAETYYRRFEVKRGSGNRA